MSPKGMALSKMIFNPLTTRHFVDSGSESPNNSGVSWTQRIPPRTIPLNPNFSVFQSNHRLVVSLYIIYSCAAFALYHYCPAFQPYWQLKGLCDSEVDCTSPSPEFASAPVSPLQSEHAVHRKTPKSTCSVIQTFLSLKSAKKKQLFM